MDEFMAHDDVREFDLRTKIGDEWATMPIAVRTDLATQQTLEIVLVEAYRGLDGLIRRAS